MTTLIQHGTLIDGNGDEALKDAWVLLEDGRIKEIGRHEAGKPPEAHVCIDASRCTVMPGLFNLHVHIQRRHLSEKGRNRTFREGASEVENSKDTKRMLWAVKNAWREMQRGVTTIRDCASKNRINIELRNLIREGIINGPRVLACGFGIAATGGHETHKYQGAVEADGPHEIRKAVRAEIKAGADFIKFMASGGIGGMPENEDPRWIEMGIDELEAGIREAHYRGKRTTVHAMGTEAILNALRAGIDCIEHGVMLNEETLTIMAERGVHYVPTLSGITAVAHRERESGKREIAQLLDRLVVNPLRNSIQRAYAKGIKMGCGTDTFGDVVEELMLLHECGLSRMECIKTATKNAAEICGLEEVTGTIETGKNADLIIVKGDPLQDLKALTRLQTVIKAGKVMDLEWLVNQ